MKLNILITGGNGFLGSALAEKFHHSEYNTTILVRKNSSLHRLVGNINYNIIEYSDEIDLNRVIEKVNPNIIINTIGNFGRTSESILNIFDSNYRIGLILLNQIVDMKTSVLFINIGTALDENTNLYSFSKHQFANLGKFLSKNFSFITFRNVRLQHIYGAGDDEKKFTSYVINSCLRNEPFINLTEGDQLRDFIYIKDAVNAIFMLCVNCEKVKLADIEVGSGNLVSIKEFVNKVHHLTNSITKLNFGAIPYRGDEFHISPANLQLNKNINWSPLYNLESALIEIIKIEKK